MGRLLGTSGTGSAGRFFKAFPGALTFDFSESIGELEDAVVAAAFGISLCFIGFGFGLLEGIERVDCRTVIVFVMFGWLRKSRDLGNFEFSNPRNFRIGG